MGTVIRVLVVDDSVVVRKALSQELERCPDIQVVGAAVDPYNAREMIIGLKPDVITLDIEMPRMDGLSFLERLMRHYPLPVVVVSSLAPKDSVNAIRALELGAVEVVCKPGTTYSVTEIGERVVQAVRSAARARPALVLPLPRRPAEPAPRVDFQLQTTHKVLAIGASTGGTNALEVILSNLPAATPGTVVVQHMPEPFTAAFAARLNDICAMEVREARDGDPIIPGIVLIARGNHHMVLQRSGARYAVRLKGGPAVHHQRPSVDVLFESVAEHAGRNAVGVILTGMGSDGAKGLLAMKRRGAKTLAQDEKTSIVFGMPREAIRMGGVDEVVSLPEMATAIVEALQEEPRRKAS